MVKSIGHDRGILKMNLLKTKLRLIKRKINSAQRLRRSGLAYSDILKLAFNRGRRSARLNLTNVGWRPKEEKSNWLLSIQNFRVAITCHVFYADFIPKIIFMIDQIPIDFDLLVTVPNETIETQLRQELDASNIQQIVNYQIKICPNRGRNFGPLLVEYGQLLYDKYDVFLHIHSKKSLHGGHEQKTWSSYLYHNLAASLHLIETVLLEFSQNQKTGMIYPVTVPGMPSWVHSWGKNYNSAKMLSETLDISEPSEGFHVYPVGGMFWARSSALKQILLHDWNYDDFPEEQGQLDGTLQHVIERIVSHVNHENNFISKFVYEQRIVDDTSFAWRDTSSASLSSLCRVAEDYDILSWDFFDTLVQRRYGYVDYAKWKVGEYLTTRKLIHEPEDYIKIRNEIELKLRMNLRDTGDISLFNITQEIIKETNFKITPEELAKHEFYEDLKILRPRREIASLYSKYSSKSIIVTDSYYNKDQIGKVLIELSLPLPRKILTSADLGKRKDRGDMWLYVKKEFMSNRRKLLHFGDNVVSDNQNPGDLGIQTHYTPSAIDMAKMMAPRSFRRYEKFHYKVAEDDRIKSLAEDIQRVFSSPFLG